MLGNKSVEFQLSYNAQRALKRGAIVGVGSVLGYLLVVVLTTPALPPTAAINAAFQIKTSIIALTGIGVGMQMFLSTYGKGLGCSLGIKNKTIGGNSGGTVMSSFFSFFSLVPLGCCGTMLYKLSLLSSFVGAGLSGALIQYSQPLAYLGIAIIFGFNPITIYKLRKEKPSLNQ